jgi:diguanylate cyclase (GGDEF)-like protein
VTPSRLRHPLATLPRRVHLVTSVVVALVVALVLVAHAGFAGERSRAADLRSHAAAGVLLDSAAADVHQTQVSIEQLKLGSSTIEAQIGGVIQLQQSAADAWDRYTEAAQRIGTASPASARVTADFARWISLSPTSGRGAAPASGTPPSVVLEQAAVGAIADDLEAVQRANDASLTTASRTQADDADLYLMWTLVAGLLAVIAIVVGNTLISRAGARFEKRVAARTEELGASVATNEFEARLQRALDLAATEGRVYSVMGKALAEAVPDIGIEMLLADSSRAHFQQLLVSGDLGSRRCSVESPLECPAAQRGAVLTFDSSRALDACPYLQEQAEPCSAVCVPVSVSGTTVGVVHAAGREGVQPGRRELTELELIARRASDRVGMLRAFAKSETQANIDPLTGLPNRRSLESKVHRLELAGTAYAVAFGDLDRFKMLNDVHGHATGDRALRLFSQVLRSALRPDDLVARYGGEEFVVVLPGCSADAASVVLERVRSHLLAAVTASDVPAFTVSFGLTEAHEGATFETLVSIADAALLEAKARGRNRVVVAGHASAEEQVPGSETAATMTAATPRNQPARLTRAPPPNG